jgi:hypothetical protein
MKNMRTAIVVLAVLLGVTSASADGDEVELPTYTTEGSVISFPSTIAIGPVTISSTNGVVTIDEGVTMDDASREFWLVVSEAYPYCFPIARAEVDVAITADGDDGAITNSMVDITMYDVVTRCVLDVDGVVDQLRSQGDMTNLVRKLVASGDVCAVVGHQWESTPHVTLEYRPDGDYPEHRVCALCGKTQTKNPVAWK